MIPYENIFGTMIHVSLLTPCKKCACCRI